MMTFEIEDEDWPLQNGFTLKDFLHIYGFDKMSDAKMQILYDLF